MATDEAYTTPTPFPASRHYLDSVAQILMIKAGARIGVHIAGKKMCRPAYVTSHKLAWPIHSTLTPAKLPIIHTFKLQAGTLDLPNQPT